MYHLFAILLPTIAAVAGAAGSAPTTVPDVDARHRSIAVAAIPNGDDCWLSGPNENNDGSLMIIDNGSSGTTNDAGCDGCKVTFRFSIIWMHTGAAGYMDPVDGETWLEVVPFEETEIASTSFSLACDTTARYDIVHDNGGATYGFTCSECR